MHQIDGAGATAENTFTEGDAQQAIPATQVTAEWLTAVQEELVAIAEHNGGVLDKEDNGQVLAKILEMITTGAGLSKDHSTNGYQELPGGLILQWGSVSFVTSGDTSLAVTFPVTFPSVLLHASWSISHTGAVTQVISPITSNETLSGMTLIADKNVPESVTITAKWFAIGK